MENYQSPTANLETGALPERPKALKAGVYLVLATFLIGFFRLPLDPNIQALGDNKYAAYLGFIVTLSIFCALLLAIWKGKNWARIVFSVFLVLGIYPSLVEITGNIESQPLFSVIAFTQLAGQGMAVVLFFLPEVNGWIRSLKESRL